VRHRIDAGSGLVAVGAAVLLVSLFLDWYEPGLNAWSVFEIVDLALAVLAVAAVVGAAGAPGPGAAMVRWGPLVSLAAVVLVVAQIVDLPPDVDGGREVGAWLALAATLAMGVGSALAVASISVTVDVMGRDRASRAAAAVDRRGDEDGGAGGAVAERREAAGHEGAVADRREGPAEQHRPQPGADLGSTQAFETVRSLARTSDEEGPSTSSTLSARRPARAGDDRADSDDVERAPAPGAHPPPDSRERG
jgi:hypothetical protein